MTPEPKKVKTDRGNRALALVVFLMALAILLSSVFGGVLPGFFLLTAGLVGVVATWAISQTKGGSYPSFKWPLVVLLALSSIAVIAFVVFGTSLHIVPMSVGACVGILSAWWLWMSGENRLEAESCSRCEDLEKELAIAREEANSAKAALTLSIKTVEDASEQSKELPAPENLFRERPNNVDDLKEINGIGPVFEKLLNDNGVYQFAQIAGFSNQDVEWMVGQLGAFPDRIERDDWVGQAKKLAK